MTVTTTRHDRSAGPPEVKGSMHPRFDEILTPRRWPSSPSCDGAFAGPPRRTAGRPPRARASGSPPARPAISWPTTATIRRGPAWRVAPPAPGLADRRCEITGPTDPQDDHQRAQLRRARCGWPTSRTPPRRPGSTSSTASSTCIDAIRGELEFTDAETARSTGRRGTPTIVVRPRGWHLSEKHLRVDGTAAVRPRWSTSGCTSSTTRGS